MSVVLAYQRRVAQIGTGCVAREPHNEYQQATRQVVVDKGWGAPHALG